LIDRSMDVSLSILPVALSKTNDQVPTGGAATWVQKIKNEIEAMSCRSQI